MKAKYMLISLIAVSLLILVLLPEGLQEKSNYPDDIIISEICTMNQSISIGTDHVIAEYVELYNYGDSPIALLGYGLSNHGERPHQWVFDDVIIEPDSYLTVVLDSSETAVFPHTAPISLSEYGDKILLSDPDGVILQQLAVPEMMQNMSYGIDNLDYQTYSLYAYGTPGTANCGPIVEDACMFMNASKIQFSHPAGFYTEPFDLTLELPSDMACIYYTLDGSIPTPNSQLYTEPIAIRHPTEADIRYAFLDTFTFDSVYPEARNITANDVNQCMVIRAQAYIENIPYGDLMTATYFVEAAGSDRYSFPVIAISTDPEAFFGDDTGIYNTGQVYRAIASSYVDGETPANYNQRGMDWEREIYLEYFDEHGLLAYADGMGVRTFGGWSRMHPKKSLKLFARSQYGSTRINYSFFNDLYDSEGHLIESFNNLVLRDGGNDWDYTMFRDSMMTDLMSDAVDVQASLPVIVFINGEYWGIYNLREAVNKNYIEDHYNVNTDDVTIITYQGGEPSLYEGDTEDLDDYYDFVNFLINNNLADDVVYQEALSMIDQDNFLSYYAAQIFYGNLDWPGNNLKMWRKDIDGFDETAPVGHDGKWRYVLYDTDFGFNIYPGLTSLDHNTIAFALESQGPFWPNPPWSTTVFRAFMENDQFKNAFINRLMDYMNTRFSADYLTETINNYMDLYEPEIEESINRWPTYNLNMLSQWKNHVYNLIGFANGRQLNMRLNIQNQFDFEPAKTLNTSAENGEIVINNCIHVTSFSGRYYEEAPITLEAVPLTGYVFTGWSGDLESSEPMITLSLEADMTVTANFDRID